MILPGKQVEIGLPEPKDISTDADDSLTDSVGGAPPTPETRSKWRRVTHNGP
jgi:hypothetical protein